jgi:hypothetical protein
MFSWLYLFCINQEMRRTGKGELSTPHPENCTNSLAPFVGSFFYSHKKIFDMAATTHFYSRVTSSRRQEPKLATQPNPPLEGQNDPPPPPLVPPPGNVEQDWMTTLEAQIAFWTRQNAELLLRILDQSHSEINREG